MTLLDAVNLALRSTGEKGVTAINSFHPQIQTILAEIDSVSQRRQNRGWWFNTRKQTLEPSGGEISTSAFTFVKATSRSLNYYPMDGILIDGNTGDPVATATECDTRWSYPTDASVWVDLPPSFTDAVGYEGALSYASNYDADQLQIQKLQVQLAQANIMLNADHTRYSKVNLFSSGSTGHRLATSWGQRYGRYQ